MLPLLRGGPFVSLLVSLLPVAGDEPSEKVTEYVKRTALLMPLIPVSKSTPPFPRGKVILEPTFRLSIFPVTVQELHGPIFTLPLGSVKFTPPVLTVGRIGAPPVPLKDMVLPGTS